MYLLILSIPFTTSIFLLLFGRFIGIKGTKLITILNMIFSNILGIYYLKKVLKKGYIKDITINNWLNIGILEEDYKIEINKETSMMTNLILIISTFIIIYSYWYLSNDPHFIRFISYLLLFSTSMLLLVNSKNILFLFLGWESVGISSYLLINYWYNNLNSNKSAIKAILYNKIGDITLLLSILLFYFLFPNTDFSNLYNFYSYFNHKNIYNSDNLSFYYSFLMISFFIAIMAKSSQFFLHPWLGDAMAGPTPVSALLHAATMVTAGIFLMIRLNILLDFIHSFNLLNYLLLFSSLLTIFLGGLSSLTQNDIKKIIAFSTASQLGYMFIANIFNSSDLSFFHLLTHGFFKALLFLTAGLIIHNFFNEQDIRKYGSFLSFLPLSYILLLISSLSLSSIPYLSGYFSKEFIIEFSFFYPNLILFLLLSLGGLITLIYSFRLIYYSFFSFPSWINNYKIINNIFEIKYYFYIIFLLLILGSILLGFFLSDFFSSNTFLESHFYNTLLPSNSYLPKYPIILNDIHLYLYLLAIPTIIMILIIIYIPIKNINILKLNLFNNLIRLFYTFTNRKFFIDSLFNSLSNLFFKSFFLFYKSFSSGLLESFSPLSFFRLLFSFPFSFRSFILYPSNNFRLGHHSLVEIFNLDAKFLFFFFFLSFLFLSFLLLLYL